METIVCVIITGLFSVGVAIINTRALHKQSEEKAAIEWAMIKRDMKDVKDELQDVKSRVSELTDTEQCCANLSATVKEIKNNLDEVSANVQQLKAESIQADDQMRKATMLIIRHTINQSHRTFKRLGFIDDNSKQSLLDLGEVYFNELGGNSFVESEIEDIKRLPPQRED